MGGDVIKVNLAHLDQAAGDLQSFSTVIEEQLAELKGRVAELHVQWGGEAAAKHAAAHEEWAQGAQLMVDAIKGLHAVSVEAHRRYQETIAANRSRFT